MGRISIEDAEHYKGSGSGSWFALKDNGDTATVRFMYRDINDASIDVVHEVEIDGKRRFVNCLRSYDEPLDTCPLCKAGSKTSLKMFVPVYNLDNGEVQIWQRGRTFASQLSGLMNRFSPLYKYPIDIERQGAKGDQTTKYQLYPNMKINEEIEWEDMPEQPEIHGSLILDKSYDELSTFVSTGSFPGEQIKARTGNSNSSTVPTRKKF